MEAVKHFYEVRPRKDKRGVDLDVAAKFVTLCEDSSNHT
jgi:hypothetical protein